VSPLHLSNQHSDFICQSFVVFRKKISLKVDERLRHKTLSYFLWIQLAISSVLQQKSTAENQAGKQQPAKLSLLPLTIT
jgi:hypothetical protein